jgi:hypothetical protein
MKQLTSSPLALLSKRSVGHVLSHVQALICSLLVLIWTTEKLASRSLSSQLFQQLTWWLCVDVWRGTCIKVSVPKRDCHSSSKGRPAPTFYRQFVSQGHEAVSLFLYFFLKLSKCTLFCSKGGSFWKHQISCPFYAIIVCLRDELKALALLSCKFYVQLVWRASWKTLGKNHCVKVSPTHTTSSLWSINLCSVAFLNPSVP